MRSESGIYALAFVVAGVMLPILLHIIAPEAMSWWPDTISLGLAFGFAGMMMVLKAKKDRESNSRLWKALKELSGHRRAH